MQYQQKLDDIERKFDDLNRQMADPAVISDSAQYRKVSKAHNELAEIVAKYRDWKTASRNLAEARPMLTESDPELRGMAEEEVARLTYFAVLREIADHRRVRHRRLRSTNLRSILSSFCDIALRNHQLAALLGFERHGAFQSRNRHTYFRIVRRLRQSAAATTPARSAVPSPCPGASPRSGSAHSSIP